MMLLTGRTRKALVGAAFTYGQFFVALGAVFFVTPQVLHAIGSRSYGLWLSSGELAGYFLLLDFGVFSILPWLIAQADGRKDPAEIKKLLSQGLTIACVMLILLLGATVVGWQYAPRVLHLTVADWRQLAPPLALLIGLLAINLPLNLFTPLLVGLQDVKFLGWTGLLKVVAGPALTLGLLLTGHGFYALAVGTAAFAPLAGAAAFLRTRRLAPELLHDWPRPTWRDTTRLFRESVGGWLGGAGTQMMERSSALVITYLGNPAMVPVLVCTSRVGQMLTQMAWSLPDQALVGLAQLSGENNLPRLREVTLSIIRLNVMLAGLMACEVLAINPAFIHLWVGRHFFGGFVLNTLLAAEVLSASFAHGLATTISVQGHRLSIGVATLLQGIIYVVLALTLTRRFSLQGLLMADLIAPLCANVPLSLWLLHSSYRISLSQIANGLGGLILRMIPCMLAAWFYGFWRMQEASLIELFLAGVIVALGYLRLMGSQLSAFPLPTEIKTLLVRFRLIPATMPNGLAT